jgi:hypothetical protein
MTDKVKELENDLIEFAKGMIVIQQNMELLRWAIEYIIESDILPIEDKELILSKIKGN